MPQFYPNFSKSDAIALAAAPIQTGRATSTNAPIVVTFPHAFADANYTLLLTPEQDGGGNYGSPYVTAKSASGFTASFPSGFGSNPVTLHWLAIHD